MKQSDIIPKKAYYVTMTDKGMSGWGEAKGKINKYVIGCDDYTRAFELHNKAKQRPEMKYVNICSTKPRYPRALVSYRDESQIRWD